MTDREKKRTLAVGNIVNSPLILYVFDKLSDEDLCSRGHRVDSHETVSW